MAGFTSPSILFLSTWDGAERAYCAELLPKLLRAGYTEYHEPAVGGFAMPLVALDAGWKPSQMVTSDTHLFTSILGEMLAGRDLGGLDVKLDGTPVRLAETDLVKQAAKLIWLQFLTRMQARPESPYWHAMIEDLLQNEEFHRGQFEAQLARLNGRLAGLDYRPQSLWAHIDRVADNPHAVIISNPPTYRNAYEQFFDTKGRLSWNVPEYDVFDAKVDIPRMVEVMEGRKALLIVQQQQGPGKAAHPKPVYARQLSPGELVFINSNRPAEVKDLMGLRAVPRVLPDMGTRPWPVLPHDADPAGSNVQLVEVDAKVADLYRNEWMHRLVAVPGSGNVMILVDGYAAGVVGYSAASMSMSFAKKWEKHVILRFAFGAHHDTLRLTRLATMLAMQQSTLIVTETPLNSMFLAASRGLVTSEMTRHPESKGLRGLMKLDNRQSHQDGYKLVYACDWSKPAEPNEVLADFLTKEAQWRKSTRQSNRRS